MRSRPSWAGAVLGLDVTCLLAVRPAGDSLARGLAQPSDWVADVGADRAVLALAGAAIWVAGWWLAIGLSAALAVSLPGPLGRMSAWCASRMLPGLLVRLVAGAAGVTVVIAPAAAGAITTPPGGGSAPASVSAPEWPTATLTPPALPRTTATAAPPSSQPPSPQAPSSQPPSSEPPPITQPSSSNPPARPAPPGPPAATGQPASVTVIAGDSLWSIAARRLEPGASAARIEAAWKRWYATNSKAIGADPGLIRPGLVLTEPLPATPSTPGGSA